MSVEQLKSNKNPFNLLVIVAALGYFVDIYDLVLFGIVRIESLRAIGVAESDLMEIGKQLINWQMGGMLIGGIIFGVLGDKLGRVSVLFGSILMYSIANIANGFVETVPMYAAMRFIAGIGLAGELGAGITLVSETMTKENRGYGTMLVATIGISGAIVAKLVVDLFDWRISYFVGGGMGIALLLMRIGVFESGMFSNIKHRPVKKGAFLSLFNSREKIKKYLSIIFVAVPVWYVVGILMVFSKEIGEAWGMKEIPDPGKSIMWCYVGITLGDLASGLLSQLIGSRKKALLIFMSMTVFFTFSYFAFASTSLSAFYTIATLAGFGTGYWAVFMTTAAEQFGTNIRATVTTTAPNFVRGSVVLLTTGFIYFKSLIGVINSAMLIGTITFIIGFIALRNLKETFGKDIDYIEE